MKINFKNATFSLIFSKKLSAPKDTTRQITLIQGSNTSFATRHLEAIHLASHFFWNEATLQSR